MPIYEMVDAWDCYPEDRVSLKNHLSYYSPGTICALGASAQKRLKDDQVPLFLEWVARALN